MARAALVVALLALAVALAGCQSTRCDPEVEVRNCGGAGEHCSAGLGERTLDWNAEAGELWPPVARLINGTPPGGVATARWTPQQEQAFWTFWGGSEASGASGQHLFFVHEGETFRVQDLPCDR